eukprot:scaffold180919_cov35-Prasinocladus_malaysianus.AAC.1
MAYLPEMGTYQGMGTSDSQLIGITNPSPPASMPHSNRSFLPLSQVPMFVAHKKGIKLDGSNPCQLEVDCANDACVFTGAARQVRLRRLQHLPVSVFQLLSGRLHVRGEQL